MHVVAIDTQDVAPVCHKQALVDSIARGNPHAEEELRLLLKIRSPESADPKVKR